MQFRTVLELHGKTATGIEVPADVVAALGGGKRPAVAVTINGHTYRSTIASMGGRSMLPVSAQVRAASGANAGDELFVTVEPDTAPRAVDVPDDLAAALDAEPRLREVWDRLSFTNQREHTESITAAKKPATRERRIEKAIEMLRAKRGS